MSPEVDLLLAELETVLARVRDSRRVEDELLARKYALMAEAYALGVPKTGDRGIAVVVRAYLVGHGWSPGDIDAVGVSEGSVQRSIDRAR